MSTEKDNKLLIITGVFVAGMIIANFVGVKLAQIGPMAISVGTPMIALTFLCTDIISDVWGKQTAKRTVWLGFGTSVLSVLFVRLTLLVPHPEYWTMSKEYDIILGGQWRLILASLVTYLVSQNLDLYVFHKIKEKTGESKLWLRNNVSTLISQLVETILFSILAFGGNVPAGGWAGLFIGQYLIRIILTLADTPLVYAGVKWVRGK